MYTSLLLALAAAVTATPLPYGDSGADKGADKGTKFISTFDDLTPGVGGVASVNEVGPYNGLEYRGINLITLGVNGAVVTGIVPDTPPNVGAIGLASAVLNGPAEISTDYDGGVFESFDFDSFYFGCVVDSVEAVASLPVSCDVTVKGYKDQEKVAEQTFSFEYKLLADGVTADMVKAKLGEEFKGIDTASFENDDVTAATLIDTLKYTVYGKDGEKKSW